MLTKPFLLHALSPLHAGTGQAVGVIDLPIARMKATGIPYLPGSSIKGVVRDSQSEQPDDSFFAAFGPKHDAAEPDHFAGALAFGDARLLLLPARSLCGTFAWVTSPLLLRLANQDGAGLTAWTQPLAASSATTAQPTKLVAAANGKMFLEEIDLTHSVHKDVTIIAGEIAKWLFFGADNDAAIRSDRTAFAERFCVVDDETMTFLWETATQVDARNRIGDNGVVAKGQLWWEESLPAETVLIGLASATNSRHGKYKKGANDFLSKYLQKNERLQFGGKNTVGRGRMRLLPKVG